MSGVPKDIYCYSRLEYSFFICSESQRTYIATVSTILFLPIELKLFFCMFQTPRAQKLQQKFCLSVCRLSVSSVHHVSVMSECKICHRPSGHSFRPISMKLGTLVYLQDTQRHCRRISEILIFSVFIGFFVFLGLRQFLR